jgi:hypothetical protein
MRICGIDPFTSRALLEDNLAISFLAPLQQLLGDGQVGTTCTE